MDGSTYSITFGSGNAKKNTWDDWNLLPESPPFVPPPKAVTNYVEIPGRRKGPLDLSRVPFGTQTYERITGSWTFVMRDDYWHTPNAKTTFDTIRGWLHGRKDWVQLKEDTDHWFYGLFTVDPPQRGKGPFAIKINYDLEPVRYNEDETVDTTWINY